MSTLAIVVLSGGLDSATTLGIAEDRHGASNVRAISFYYGQRHHVELQCAGELAAHYGILHHTIRLPQIAFKGGVLTTDQEVPDMSYDDLPSGVMSPTYVPFRNGNLLSMAAAYADSLLQEDEATRAARGDNLPPAYDGALVYAGMHAEDGAGFAYADCTPEFLGAMAAAIHVGTYGRVRLQALFQYMTKADIIRKGMRLGVPYHLTHSCYKGVRPACGVCSTCRARKEAFALAGVRDPIDYKEDMA